MTALRGFAGNLAACGGVIAIALVLILALAAPYLYPGSPWEMVGSPFVPPMTDGYILGTDMLGRDVAAGIAHGARFSLLLALSITVAAMGVGILIGILAGYFGGTVDNVLMRCTEFVQTVPNFLLAVVLITLFRPSILSIIIVIAAVSWPPIAYLVRVQFMALRNAEYVQAAIALGESTPRIVFRQILPNAIPPVIVAGSLMVGTAILMESALSFLGLGDPDLMTWGYMIGATRNLVRDAWWMCTFPGLAIFITVLAINLIGDGLSDALNPRLVR
jgi:peptide/nickel transport system permease protein